MTKTTKERKVGDGKAHAVVWNGPDDGFRRTTVALPDLETDEVLVKMRMASICGSDLHTVHGDRPTPLPTILGHEMVGEVIATGGRVRALDGRALEPGMRVVWTIGASCGVCRRCERGMPQKCLRLRKYGHEALSRRWYLNGGLATHCHLLPGTGIVVVPDDVPDAVAVPASCATSTVACAVRRAGDVDGGVTAILGCGMLGLTLTAYLRYAGAREVIACDPDPDRRVLARALGATHATTPEGLKELTLEASDGEGADASFEMSGNPSAIGLAIDLLATGGVAGLVGSVSPSDSVPLDPESTVRRMKTIVGTHNYAPPDLVDAVRFLASTPYKDQMARLVSVAGVLEDAEHAVARAGEKGAYPRVAIAS